MMPRRAGLMPGIMGEMWGTMGSSIAGFLFMWAFIRPYIPHGLSRYVEKYTQRLFSFAYPYIMVSIHEYTADQLKRNEAYSNVEAYLGVNSSKNVKRLKAEMAKKQLILRMDDHETVTDEFNGTKVWWSLSKTSVHSGSAFHNQTEQERRYYRLVFHKRYREVITDSYLKRVMDEGKAVKAKKQQRKLYTNSPGHKWPGYHSTMWSHIVFEHPASFQTLAMDPEKKREIMDDLLAFSRSKEYYAKIGKAWKRGYLLHGPPGTGKSTMIAAIAKLLEYDVYDLELTAVRDNTELRRLLIEVSNKSILVIEDIDCSLDLTGQRNKKPEKPLEDDTKDLRKTPTKKEAKDEGTSSGSKVTLSGLLNFIDGLWSACGGERLVIFTTNYVEKLDPALIRRGRMDKHIELSYCNFEAFKVLAQNYLDVDSHPLFETIHELLDETNISPADVAESLMPKSISENADTCLSNLIQALKEANEEAAKLKAKEELQG